MDQQYYKFSKGNMINVFHFRFSIFVLETLKFKKKGRHSHWQCDQYLQLNHTCQDQLCHFVLEVIANCY